MRPITIPADARIHRRCGFGDPEEPFEDPQLMFLRDADALVLKLNPHFLAGGKTDLEPRTRWRVFNCIVDEDKKQLPQKRRVTIEQNIRLQLTFYRDLLAARQWRRERAGFFQNFLQV